MEANDMLDWYRSIDTSRAEEVKLDFAVDLDKAIKTAGLTRQAFAVSVGISNARVTKVLRGDSNLTIETMDKLARAVDMDLHVHLARKGAKVRWFDLIPTSLDNTIQSANPSESYAYAVQESRAVVQPNRDQEERIAL